MVMHVIHSLSGVQPTQTVIVVGHGADQVTARVTTDSPSWANVSFASQVVQRGTGDAVSVGLTALDQSVATTAASDRLAEHDDMSTILVLPGDTPLLRR
jgi:bifunctional UDP-N-acetylglucosamine pyrophosphorylase/glucosamine-1-phosphate N-acetyltransferase